MLKDFLTELEELANKHGVTLYSCECCDGVNVYDENHQTYFVQVMGGKLSHSTINERE